ncbi:MAG: hypothetical protein FJX56_14840, partial [Alphaproteobacteria bacterium]|nr:hypothetical protein [Alphaproteobacteria bacterium]
MVQFTRLRLSGFKSFVEPTDLLIEPGLTGIVGPNGCGKSNLIEAIRWVMGENAPRNMRGGEMDDVIFSGTAKRPARNFAEVALAIDNSDRTAPAAFNDGGDIEVTRRIERGEGSLFRVNGREVRAQDVRLLFADSATGPHASALVGQGQIGALIGAKPITRRALLEEAAGITGLHSRRHEAELRLHAAESNLTRLDDVIATLEVQLNGLRRQARQATRYRNLSRDIRRTEARLLHRRWLLAAATVEAAEARLALAEQAVRERTAAAAAASATEIVAGEQIPALRQQEANAAAAIHRLSLARQALESAEVQLAAEIDEQTRQLAQISADRAREERLGEEARAALERLAGEQATLATAAAAAQIAEREASAGLAAAASAVEAENAALTELAQRIASHDSRRAALIVQVQELTARRERLDTEHAARAA